MTMLYLYDGQTSELLDETFRTWGPQTVGYGADAIIFGPQFGSFHRGFNLAPSIGVPVIDLHGSRDTTVSCMAPTRCGLRWP